MAEFETNQGTFDADVVEASKEKLVLLDIWAPWCGPCRMLSPILEEIASDSSMDDMVKIVKMNADDNQEMLGMDGLKVQGIPTMLFYKGGEEVDRIVGLPPQGKDSLVAKIKELQ